MTGAATRVAADDTLRLDSAVSGQMSGSAAIEAHCSVRLRGAGLDGLRGLLRLVRGVLLMRWRAGFFSNIRLRRVIAPIAKSASVCGRAVGLRTRLCHVTTRRLSSGAQRRAQARVSRDSATRITRSGGSERRVRDPCGFARLRNPHGFDPLKRSARTFAK